MQAFAQQLKLLIRVMKNLKDEMTFMRQQHSGIDGFRMVASWRGNIIWRAIQNVKIDFVYENAIVDDDDYNFASIGNRDRFKQNWSWKNVIFSQGGTIKQRENSCNFRSYEDSGGELRLIKMKIIDFHRKNDLEAYLEWENKVKWIFDYHHHTKQKKVQLIIIEFTYYALIWWDQLVLSMKRNGERPID